MSSTQTALKNQKDLLQQPRIFLTPTERACLIETLPWSNELSFTQIKRLAEYFDAYQVPAGTVLFREGDKEIFVVLIVKGTVSVIKTDSMHNEKCIAMLGPGNTVGEMGLIDGQPRSATAVSTVQSLLLLMGADKFERLMNEWPRIGTILVLKISRIMSQYLRQASGRLADRMSAGQ